MQRSSPAKNCSCTACECATQTSYDMPLDFINTMGPWTSTCAEAIITASHTHARIQAQTMCIRIRICLIVALKLVYHSNQAHPALEVQSKLTCKHQLRIITRHPWRPKTAHGSSTCTAQAWTIKPDPIQKLCSGFSPCLALVRMCNESIVSPHQWQLPDKPLPWMKHLEFVLS